MSLLMNLPQDWIKKSIKSVCLGTEQWIPSKDKRDFFHYIDVSSVSNNTYSIKDVSLVRAEIAPGRARKIVKWQDTIYATIRPSLKRVALITKEYDNQIASTAFCIIRPDQKIVNPLYIYYFLLSDFLNEEIAGLQHGASYPAVTDNDVMKQVIFFPPIPEQKRIIAVLSSIQKAIEVQESIIERTQELKRTVMHRVFAHGIRGEKLKDTDIGQIPASWNIKHAKDIFILSSGKTSPASVSKVKSSSHVYPIYGGNGIMAYADQYFISSDVLVIGRVGEYCGAVYVSSGNSWISDNALYSKEWIDSNIKINYVSAYLKYFDLNKLKRRSSQPLLTQGIIQSLIIPVPPSSEQELIVDTINALDQKINHHTTKRTTLQDLFKTMLNKLMTGEIRVNDLDTDVQHPA